MSTSFPHIKIHGQIRERDGLLMTQRKRKEKFCACLLPDGFVVMGIVIEVGLLIASDGCSNWLDTESFIDVDGDDDDGEGLSFKLE